MFFKGLRSDYVTRGNLNEANQARKNEDLNKIIDIGRSFLERGGRPGSGGDGKCETSPEYFREDSDECDKVCEQCSLSPISLGLTHEDDSSAGRGKLSSERELQKFSEKYEETVGSLVLHRLPEGGVLEDALKTLRQMRLPRGNRPDDGAECLLSKYEKEDGFVGEFKEKDIQFLNELRFSRENLESEVSEAEDFIRKLISPEKSLSLETRERDCFVEKPVNRMLIISDVEMENYHHPSFTPSFDKEGLDAFHFQDKNFDSPTKQFSITTPPIQFYRRNMF